MSPQSHRHQRSRNSTKFASVGCDAAEGAEGNREGTEEGAEEGERKAAAKRKDKELKKSSGQHFAEACECQGLQRRSFAFIGSTAFVDRTAKFHSAGVHSIPVTIEKIFTKQSKTELTGGW